MAESPEHQWPAGPSADFRHGELRVAPNRRFLVHADGTPFFYLADTAWELLHRGDREDVEHYLETRRAQGFTAFQTVVLAELDGLNTPNAYGERALEGNDPARPNEAYFRHVDFTIDRAAERGLVAALLPSWGDKLTPRYWGQGPEVFRPENARTYGHFLGARYRERPNLIWVLGGDRPAESTAEVWRAMAAGLREGDGGRHLVTYHPQGGHSSADWLQGEPWLDFHMLQSGHHRRDIDNYAMVARDYARTPVRPCFDAEPRYEDHPVNWKAENGYFDAWDVRQGAYWAVFAGGHGHTYGCQDVWQLWCPPRAPVAFARTPWRQALLLPGAWDMGHLRRLIESRPFLDRVPDQELIVEGQAEDGGHLQATRGAGYALIYSPLGRSCSVQLGRISGSVARAWWYDPREGTAAPAGDLPNRGTHTFVPPSAGRGQDWVLVLDDAQLGLPAPGAGR